MVLDQNERKNHFFIYNTEFLANESLHISGDNSNNNSNIVSIFENKYNFRYFSILITNLMSDSSIDNDSFQERLLKIIPTLQSIIPVSLDYTNLGSIGIRSFSNNITFIEPEYEKVGMIQLQFLLDLPEDILYEDYFNVLGIINSNLNGNVFICVNVEVDEKRITIYLNNNEESNSLTQTDNLQLRHNFDQLLVIIT